MHPAQVRHHLKKLEALDLVELAETRVQGGFVEKYYRATARAFLVNLAVIPHNPERETVIALGSHDPALEHLALTMRADERTPDVFALPAGSLDGLVALRQGVCNFSGVHLLDVESGEYNRPHVQHLFPGQSMRLLTLAHRQQGLLLAPGNPRNIRALADLSKEGVTFVNRRKGSGTRLWLDARLRQQGIPTSAVEGYTLEVSTHDQVAEHVARGQVDAGIGVMAAARARGLAFVPLFKERFDLVIPEKDINSPLLAPLLDHLQTTAFRKDVEALAGYDTAHTGESIEV